MNLCEKINEQLNESSWKKEEMELADGKKILSFTRMEGNKELRISTNKDKDSIRSVSIRHEGGNRILYQGSVTRGKDKPEKNFFRIEPRMVKDFKSAEKFLMAQYNDLTEFGESNETNKDLEKLIMNKMDKSIWKGVKGNGTLSDPFTLYSKLSKINYDVEIRMFTSNDDAEFLDLEYIAYDGVTGSRKSKYNKDYETSFIKLPSLLRKLEKQTKEIQI